MKIKITNIRKQWRTIINTTNTKKIKRKNYAHKFNLNEMKKKNSWEAKLPKVTQEKVDILNNSIYSKEMEFAFQNHLTTKIPNSVDLYWNSSKHLRKKYWFNTNLTRLWKRRHFTTHFMRPELPRYQNQRYCEKTIY